MKKRNDNLRDFQVLDGAPKIFVSTVSAGNCGINVQSATRVYLMEPSIDPATEIQVAGRIHRLGQLNDVLVRRLCFRDTVEEKVCSLHDKIKNGDAKFVNGKVPAAVAKSLTSRPGDPPSPPPYRKKIMRPVYGSGCN